MDIPDTMRRSALAAVALVIAAATGCSDPGDADRPAPSESPTLRTVTPGTGPTATIDPLETTQASPGSGSGNER